MQKLKDLSILVKQNHLFQTNMFLGKMSPTPNRLEQVNMIGIAGLSANALQFVRHDHILDNSKIEKELGFSPSHNFYAYLD